MIDSDEAPDLAVVADAAWREKARREMARRHLLDFCTYVWPGFVVRPYRALIASALEGCHLGKWRRLMIFTPPQYGKSTIMSRMFPAWWLGKRPDENIILASYAAGLAHGFSREARNLVKSTEYRAVFGDLAGSPTPIELADDSRAVHEWRLQHHRGGMVAAGVGGGITGKSGYLALIDDPIKDSASADSLTIREGQKEWYRTTLYTRLSPLASLVLTMTRWHEEDMAGWLLNEQKSGGDEWTVLRLSTMAESAKERAAWCKRSNIPPERFLVADRNPNDLEPVDYRLIQAVPWSTLKAA